MCGGYSKLFPSSLICLSLPRRKRLIAVCSVVNRDDWISKYRMTNFSKEKVMAATFVG